MTHASHDAAPPLHGWSRLVLEGVIGVVDVVEAMHDAVTRLPGAGRSRPPGRTRALAGLVYGSVRGVTRGVGWGLERALALAAPGPRPPSRREERLRAALCGVMGDRLEAAGSPLALPMALRHGSRTLPAGREALAAALPHASGRVAVLVHGVCLEDGSWGGARGLGGALERRLGFTPLALRYNTGRHVAANGHDLAALLEDLVASWPVPLERLVLVGYSMGGLVSRSACAQAEAAGQAWRARLTDLVFVGTPHLGAPLERAGAFVTAALGVSRYTVPLGRVGRLRSAGITDLARGEVLDGPVAGEDRHVPRRRRPRPVPLPAGVRCHAVAGLVAREDGRAARLVGDGLVPVRSALGQDPDPARALDLPDDRCLVLPGTGHLALLTSPAVRRAVRRWLAGEPVTAPAAGTPT